MKLRVRLVAVVVGVCCACVLFLCGCEKMRIMPPVSVRFRNSLLNTSTRVMQLTNRSCSELLVLDVSVKNKENPQGSAKRIFKVGPGQTKEVGVFEMGWTFTPGESISIQADGYILPVQVTVP